MLIFFVGFSLAACSEVNEVANPIKAPTATLFPYQTPSPQFIEKLQVTLAMPPSPPPQPTPTAMTHKVVKGDTMLGIALRYGVSLEDLIAANPDINPSFLSIDTLLVIPAGENENFTLSLLTPLPLNIEDPICYPLGGGSGEDGGAWCFALVKNNQPIAVENLSAWVGLFSTNGKVLARQVAITPLNILPPGRALPLLVYFPPPVPGGGIPFVDLVSASPVITLNDRYLEVELDAKEMEIGLDGLQATVRGSIFLPEKRPAASLIWIVASAYDSSNEIVGVRKWEAEQNDENPPAILKPGQNLPFELTVFSLGPPINRVELLVEARP